MGSFVLQHLVTPPIRNQPIMGTFSYHLSCLPQKQWLLPLIDSCLFVRSITTEVKEEREAPRNPKRTTRIMANKISMGWISVKSKMKSRLFCILLFSLSASTGINPPQLKSKIFVSSTLHSVMLHQFKNSDSYQPKYTIITSISQQTLQFS